MSDVKNYIWYLVCPKSWEKKQKQKQRKKKEKKKKISFKIKTRKGIGTAKKKF